MGKMPSNMNTEGGRPAHNLTPALTAFIGRRAEIAEADALLERSRLLTLVGPPGVGKTRLAIRLGEGRIAANPGGTHLVELASRREQWAPVAVLAGLLGIVDQPEDQLLATLSARLAEAPSLILLDNCEHLVGACAELASHLLRACPQLRILATSREPLGVPGEAVLPLLGMSLTEPGSEPRGARLLDSDALQLFCDRVATRRGRYDVGPELARTLVEICRRVDGLPLAIELAAGRVSHLPEAEILARLDDFFSLLAGGPRAAASGLPSIPHWSSIRTPVEK